jgi:hypothetical protein
MAIWVEINCDKQTAVGDVCSTPLCHSTNGSQPGAMTKDATSVPETLRRLKQDALKSGWTYANGTWTCPVCRPPTHP